MDLFPRMIGTILVATSLASSAFAQMSSRESSRISQGKITKNEAQHLVMRQFPGAKVKRCELRTSRAGSFWVLDVVKPGSNDVTKMQVDGRTGKLLGSGEAGDAANHAH